MVHTILVVEDDSNLQNYLKEFLTESGYSVKTASDGASALNMLKSHEPDLVVLDRGLPNMTGDAVCIEIKKKYSSMPIILLTGKDATADIVQGLNLGADDYITKPFVADEFLARVKVRLRQQSGGEEKLKIENLELNNKTLEVKRDGKLISLTPKEFKLLEYLMSNRGRILTREMILNRVWLYNPEIETRVVDVYMGYLRKKIDSGYDKHLIHSVRGFGYTIKE